MVVSILSERRAFQPWGLCGGGPGARGLNLLRLASDGGRLINLGGKNTVHVGKGDAIMINSPGGGGYGEESDGTPASAAASSSSLLMRTSGSLHQYTLSQESV